MNESQGFQPVGNPGQPGQSAPVSTDVSNERTLAAVSYILTWITGLIILLVAKKEQRYARWHAIQAIGLGIVLFVLSWIVSLMSFLVPFGGVGFMPMSGGLGFVVWILAIVLIVVLAVQAYQGKSVRIPVLADFADKQA